MQRVVVTGLGAVTPLGLGAWVEMYCLCIGLTTDLLQAFSAPGNDYLTADLVSLLSLAKQIMSSSSVKLQALCLRERRRVDVGLLANG